MAFISHAFHLTLATLRSLFVLFHLSPTIPMDAISEQLQVIKMNAHSAKEVGRRKR